MFLQEHVVRHCMYIELAETLANVQERQVCTSSRHPPAKARKDAPPPRVIGSGPSYPKGRGEV